MGNIDVETKKILYIEKPTATVTSEKNPEDKIKRYKCNTSLGEVLFDVPYDEMGENEFEDELPAQLLIRWMRTKISD